MPQEIDLLMSQGKLIKGPSDLGLIRKLCFHSKAEQWDLYPTCETWVFGKDELLVCRGKSDN